MPFLAGSPIPTGVCEWDVMGAYRGEPAELVKCETVDLEVPASGRDRARGVHQRRSGHLGDGGAVRRVHRLRLRRADAAADHEGHLHHPPARSDLPRLPGGHAARLLQREQRDVVGAARRHRLEHPQGRRHPRHQGRLRPPDHQRREHRACRSSKAYQGQPKQIAAALWGNSAAQYRYKHVYVVEDDIDASSYEQIDWALAHRVNAGEGGLVVFPGIFGSPIDPSHADGGPRRRAGSAPASGTACSSTPPAPGSSSAARSGAASASRPPCARRPRTRRACARAGTSTGSGDL